MLMAVMALAAAWAIAPDSPSNIRCSTWTDLRAHPPTAAVAETYVGALVDAFNLQVRPPETHITQDGVFAAIDQYCKQEPQTLVIDNVLSAESVLAYRHGVPGSN
jgi:hypothetical protein